MRLQNCEKAMSWCTEEEDEEEDFGHLATFWLGTFAIFFHAPECVVYHENT